MAERLIAARIRQARRSMPFEHGRTVTQESFAKKLGVHWTTVSAWERGANAPTLANLQRIALLTDKSIAFFVEPPDIHTTDDVRDAAEGLVQALLAAESSAAHPVADDREAVT